MTEPTTYSLYLDNDLNRVFTDAVPALAATELRIVADRLLPGSIEAIERVDHGRASLLRFTARSAGGAESGASADGEVGTIAELVSRLSASAALFRHHVRPGDPGELLEPVPLDEALCYGTDLVTTQRYRGKTNERLTRAMLNVALATAGIDPRHPAGTVLDPMCGRGTTLNWALAYGLDAVGIDVDRASVEHHRTFIETWAKRRRLPHKATQHRPGNAEHRWLSLRIAPDRAALKADRGQRVQTFHADGADESLPIRARSVDAIIGDLPYGIQHQGSGRPAKGARPSQRGDRSSSGGRSGGGRPDPVDPVTLLEPALSTWRRWLRPGGALCLAWNLKQVDRDTVSRILVEAGMAPVVAAGGFSMRHTVDASIERDVIVAHRP